MARSRLSTNPSLRGNRVRTSTGNTTNSVRTKNFVRVEPVELARQERYFANAMFAIILSLLCSIRQGFRTRAAIQAEILALRHQLLVLQRSAPAHKSRHPQGRPSLSREVIDLIRRMSLANPRWGAPRIHGDC